MQAGDVQGPPLALAAEPPLTERQPRFTKPMRSKWNASDSDSWTLRDPNQTNPACKDKLWGTKRLYIIIIEKIAFIHQTTGQVRPWLDGQSFPTIISDGAVDKKYLIWHISNHVRNKLQIMHENKPHQSYFNVEKWIIWSHGVNINCYHSLILLNMHETSALPFIFFPEYHLSLQILSSISNESHVLRSLASAWRWQSCMMGERMRWTSRMACSSTSITGLQPAGSPDGTSADIRKEKKSSIWRLFSL